MSETDPLVGTTLGPCRLEALVGRGGMGRVYKARHVALDRPVAVKLVDLGAAGDAAAVRAQILAEARSAAKLDDPRIVAIYEVGESGGVPYIVMQWVDGETLEQRVQRAGRLPPPAALEIVRETARALEAAHRAGVVHRDVKPGNILIDGRGSVKLADFGLARPAGDAAAAGETAAGSFHFMSPEQGYGGAPDPRADLYSLGATWYYALTGQPPFPGSALDALMRHRDEAPPEVRLLCPETTEKAARVLGSLLAKAPEARPADAGALLALLGAAGLLLETDASGSPFRILPAAPRPAPAPVAAPREASVAAAPAAPARPAPPPPLPPPALGSRRAFLTILCVFGVTAFGWQWRRAGPEDWAAAAAALALVPAALTFGERLSASRKLWSALTAAAALACWARQASASGAAAPGLEAAILAALGLIALAGSVYLGQWGSDRSEALWSRALGPVASACLLLSALTWSVSDAEVWSVAARERGAAWWGALAASGGGWRWLGGAGLAAALAAAARLQIRGDDAPKDRTLNWNR